MVMANRALLLQVRRLAIRDELLAMQLRGRLVAPEYAQPESPPVDGPGSVQPGVQACTTGNRPAGRPPRRLDGKG